MKATGLNAKSRHSSQQLLLQAGRRLPLRNEDCVNIFMKLLLIRHAETEHNIAGLLFVKFSLVLCGLNC